MYENLSAPDTEQLFYDVVTIYDGEPVHVWKTQNQFLYLKELKSGNNIPGQFLPDDEKFNHNPVPLGFVNFFQEFTTHLVERIPKRQYKVGLHSSNSGARNPINGKSIIAAAPFTRTNKNIRDTILRIYPRYWDLLNYFSTTEKGVLAFHPFFALSSDLEIYFKLNRIGQVNADNGKILFKKQYKFIESALNKVEIFSEK